ncbi:MAG: hypothetical protein WAR79_06360 [Melioribacteraceae bacterium]
MPKTIREIGKSNNKDCKKYLIGAFDLLLLNFSKLDKYSWYGETTPVIKSFLNKISFIERIETKTRINKMQIEIDKSEKPKIKPMNIANINGIIKFLLHAHNGGANNTPPIN